MTRSNQTKQTIPNRRRLTIIESALSRREKQVPINQAFDPVKFIEQTLPKIIRDFDFDYWDEHPSFLDRPDRLAFVDFTEGVQLFVRSKVVEGAYGGDNESRFALAHEIGHVFLHRAKAHATLSRHSYGSPNQFKGNPILEHEASLFAGTLLAPPSGISPLMNTFEIRRKYRCSEEVAQKAKIDADFWRKQGT